MGAEARFRFTSERLREFAAKRGRLSRRPARRIDRPAGRPRAASSFTTRGTGCLGRRAWSRMTLGRVSTIPLAKAREMAQDALVLARQGIDPAAARRASARAARAARSAEPTLDTFLAEYLDVQRAEGVETAPERVAAISRHAPALVRRPLRDLVAPRSRGSDRHRAGKVSLGRCGRCGRPFIVFSKSQSIAASSTRIPLPAIALGAAR